MEPRITASREAAIAYDAAMLILFDIDATLLLTDGAGLKAMHEAGRELFGGHFSMEGVEFSGRLDPLIWADLARLNRIENADEHHDRFRATYGRHLATRLQAFPTARLLPGARELVGALCARGAQPEANGASIMLGLLTGNYPETGRLKIQHAGLDPDLFQVAAWGHEGRTRRDLPPVAMRRCGEMPSRRATPAPHEVIIIGDTPYDIDCARAHGCRSIGVATGAFSVELLRDSGADLAVENLASTQEILGWMLQAPAVIHE